MNISKISKTLKAFIIGTAALELALLIFAAPWIGQSLVSAAPDYADCYYPRFYMGGWHTLLYMYWLSPGKLPLISEAAMHFHLITPVYSDIYMQLPLLT